MMNGRTLRHIEFDNVADLYDHYVRTDFDIPFWLDQTKLVKGKVLELTCGTGRVSIPLLKAGIDLSCVDYAPKMLAQLERKLEKGGLSCPVYCQNIAELNIPDQFDLIFIPFHSFSETVERKRQRLTLKRIHSHLTPQGIFICTLQNPVVRTSSMDGMMKFVGDFPLPDGRTLVIKTKLTFDTSSQIASGEQVYEQFSVERELVERRILNVTFYLFQKSEFETLLDECGFSVQTLYGDYEGHPFDNSTSPFMVWKTKRSETAS